MRAQEVLCHRSRATSSNRVPYSAEVLQWATGSALSKSSPQEV